MITVSELHIYPVKSLKGLSLKTLEITPFGPHMDRRFMLIDSEKRFITQRKYHQLALVKTALNKKSLTIEIPKQAPIDVPFNYKGDFVDVVVWNDTCRAIDQGDEVAKKFTEFLDMDVRLVYMPDETFRPVNPKYALHPSERVGFADAVPFLITTESTLEDLEKRAGMKLLMNRFRPNIVLRGASPYAEDNWQALKIGEVLFRIAKPCTRCVTTCVNQETGEKGVEPLQTLATYRKTERGIIFGQNAIHESQGTLSLNDPVEIIR